MQDFRKLLIWDAAHRLTLNVYAATNAYPTAERYGLTGQTRRACASIAANIAEGCGRGSPADFARFLQIAMGSACELENHLLLARDLNLLPLEAHLAMSSSLTDLKRMLAGLRSKITPRHASRRPPAPTEN